MNSKKFFAMCSEKGINTAELVYSRDKKTSFAIFRGEIDNYSISNQSELIARGIYNGKISQALTEDLSVNGLKYLVNVLLNADSIIEKAEEPIIFEGSKKYFKKNVFNSDLAKVSIDEKIKLAFEMEKYAYSLDPRVKMVNIEYEEEESEKAQSNTYGLSLKNKTNYFVYVTQVIVSDGEENKVDYSIFFDNDFSKFDYEKEVRETVERALSKLNGKPLESGEYKCVFSPNATATLLSAMINTGCSAENIQKNSSVLIGKLNTQVFSKKVTIEEKPLTKNAFFTYFDDEGVATQNKVIVKNGVLNTYLYNLETAKKDGVESTGNGYQSGTKIGIRTRSLTLKAGKLSEEELFAHAGSGIYVTGLSGVHSGLNASSGSFSLEAEGYHIENGKKASAITLFTVGGNIYDLFRDVLEVGNNSKLIYTSVTAPSILVKGIKASGM